MVMVAGESWADEFRVSFVTHFNWFMYILVTGKTEFD
jgi:hypothetical protein